MTELTKVSAGALKALEGICEDTSVIRLAVMLDMNRDGIRAENWLFASKDKLYSVCGSPTLRARTSGKPALTGRAPKAESSFSMISYDVFELEGMKDFKVEELISTCRFTAKDKDGNFVLLSMLTNTCKGDLHTFIKYLGRVMEKDDATLDEDDKKLELFCPKCGNRYADPELKICPKCMDKGKIIRRTARFFLKYKLSIAAMIGILILSSVLSIVTPYFSSGFYYDQVLNKAGEFYGQIILVLIIVVGTSLLGVLNSIFNGLVSSRVAAKVSYDLKKTIFDSIERLSISFFTGRQTGGLMNQVNNDAGTIYWFFCDCFPYFVINIVQVIAVFIIMLRFNPLLTLLSMITVPFAAMMIRWLFERMGKLHAKRYGRQRAMNSVLSDVLSGVRVVKAFAKEKNETERFNSRSEEFAQAEKNTSFFGGTAFPLVSFILYLSSIVVWGVGGWMVINGEMTYGILTTFIAYMGMIQSPLFFFVDMINMMADSMNAMQRLIEVMDAVPDVVESEHPVPLGEVKGLVEFRNVSFSYVKNRKVIDDVSFDVQPGEKLGIVGHTGAGKSTLVNLLIRLYDCNEGEIRVDGVNVKDISFADLRNSISIVSQETYLFAGTIMDNIRYAKPDATKEEVIEAAKIAGAHDFIMKLPDAYLTQIGFGYKDLSGGERQRVSIARAILRNPKILIMDEATAAMDTETERQIQTALERLVVGRTTIMIAHRLSTLRDADKLIVIENGKAPEAGTHMELIKKKGIYYKLYQLQMDALRNIGVQG